MMEEFLDETLDIKPEPEEPVDYPLPELEVIAGPLDIEIPTESQLVDQFCRLCLRDRGTLYPIMSRVQTIMLPDMIAAVTGIRLNPRDKLPKKVCIQCVVKLDYAYHIRLEFADSHRVLKNLNSSRLYTLGDSLRDYQKGVLANTETRSDKLLRQNRSIIQSRLIRKEGQIEEMTVDKLIETDEIEAHQVEQNDKDKVEIVLNSEEMLNVSEILQTSCEAQDEPQHPTEVETLELIVSDGCESSTEQKEQSQVENGKNLGKSFEHKVEVKETKPDPNKCYICKTVFENSNDLEVHLPKHVHMVPYDCEECKATNTHVKTIHTVIMLHRHFRMHSGTRKCPKCAFRTYTSTGLYGHKKRYHLENANTVYTCEVCGANVTNKNAFENHLRMHQAVDEGRFTCSFCAKKFATKTRLERHERIHTNERPYQCRYCPKTFTNETAFHIHERTHTGERGYRCEECDKNFRTKCLLNIHLASVHNTGTTGPSAGQNKYSKITNKEKHLFFDKPIKCSHEGCDFETKVRSKYYHHKGKHDLKFNCPDCDQRFPTKQRLIMHSFVHTEQKSYCCDVCGKSFRFRGSFVEHMDSHSNIRRHSCKICNSSFVRRRNLMEHMRKHSDDLAYTCRYCGKKLRYRADLSKHERTHTTKEAVTKQEEVETDFATPQDQGMDVILEELVDEGEMVEYLDE